MNAPTGASAGVARLQEYVRADPGNWNLRAELFDAALAAGAFDVARAEAERALQASPTDGPWQHRLATLLLATRQYAEAERAFEALVARGHDDPAVRHNLAFSMFAQGRYDDAAATVAPLLPLADDTGGMAWALWIRCLHRLHRHPEAIAAFAAESTRRPMAPEAWGAASLVAFDEERPAEARAWADRALAGRPDQLEALVTRASLALGDQDVAEATRSFGRALHANPTDGRSWSGLAFTKMLQLDLAGATDAFQKAVATMPGHVGTWLGYGWARIMANDLAGARGAFERALQLDRNVAETHGALAVVYARLGQRDRAQEEVEIAKRLDPRNLGVRYAEAVLSGEASDPAAFQRLARRVLAKVPAGPEGSGKTLVDLVFKERP